MTNWIEVFKNPKPSFSRGVPAKPRKAKYTKEDVGKMVELIRENKRLEEEYLERRI